MKILLNIFVCCIIAITSTGQEISKQVIANTGNSISAGNYQLEQTVGETVITTYTQGNVVLCQGFQQADGSTIVSVEELDDYSFNYYPNPVVNELNIALEQVEDRVAIDILDQSGRILNQRIKEYSNNFQLDFNGYTPGIYFVQLIIRNQKIKFKIIKN